MLASKSLVRRHPCRRTACVASAHTDAPELHDGHAGVKEAAREGDVDCCLDLVPRKDPHFDPGGNQRRDGLGDAVL